MKNYDQWNNYKKQLEERTNVPSFHERDVWWCSLGVNIGQEIDGKNANAERPVCIVKKFGRSSFFGLPLSSNIKTAPYRYLVTLENGKSAVLIDQGRTMSAKRLQRRFGRMKRTDFRDLKTRLRKIFWQKSHLFT
jgi:mRNA-degrading endonuclease toxin of MazEF toxin-antitoxin module